MREDGVSSFKIEPSHFLQNQILIPIANEMKRVKPDQALVCFSSLRNKLLLSRVGDMFSLYNHFALLSNHPKFSTDNDLIATCLVGAGVDDERTSTFNEISSHNQLDFEMHFRYWIYIAMNIFSCREN